MTQPQKSHAATNSLVGLVGLILLHTTRLAKQRARPGAIENTRRRRRTRSDPVDLDITAWLAAKLNPDTLLVAKRDVSDDPAEELSKALRPAITDTLEHATSTKTLNEDLLNSVVDLVAETRRTPTITQVTSDRVLVTQRESVAVFGQAFRGVQNDRPSGRVGVSRESGHRFGVFLSSQGRSSQGSFHVKPRTSGERRVPIELKRR